jgi:hypothetical protein
MCQPNELVSNLLDALHIQLIAKIDTTIHSDPNADYALLEPIKQHPQTWVQMEPYFDWKFEYEHAEFSLLQLCNIVQMLFGIAAEWDFVKELTTQVKDHIEQRLTLYRLEVNNLLQLQLNDELEQAAGMGMTA